MNEARMSPKRAGGAFSLVARTICSTSHVDAADEQSPLYIISITYNMSPMMEDDPIDADQDGFMLLQHGHKDMVEAAAFNAYGDRFASSSVDGRIKVYNRHRDGSWNLCDTWGAHTAEILQVWLCLYIAQNAFGYDRRNRC